MNLQLNKIFNQLWASVISDCYFDIKAHKIRLDLQIERDSQTKPVTLIFEEVWGYCFVSEITSEPKIEPTWNIAELTSVHWLFPQKKLVSVSPNNLTQSVEATFQADFALEIWGAVLYISAKSVSIGEETFVVR